MKRKWKQHGITVAGGYGMANELNQLSYPRSLYVDDDEQRIYIADRENDRIVAWKFEAKKGEAVAGGNEQENGMNQLDRPTVVMVDQKTDSLIIRERGNRRVVRWSRQHGTTGETIISDIASSCLTMDMHGDLYVSDVRKNEVRRWKIGETKEMIAAGGNVSVTK